MTINASKYNIELRDKAGNLKAYLTPFVSSVNWIWNRKGGCGRAKVTVKMPYRKITFNALDDIQIRLEDNDAGGSKLVYRGWVATATPKLQMGQEISLDVRGYWDLLKYIMVQDGGDLIAYEGYDIHDIVDNIADTFIVPNTAISKGTIDVSTFNADRLEFQTSVQETLRTLADLLGDVEYGVDENLAFFWRTQNTSVRRKFIVGSDIAVLSRKVDYSQLVNKIYFEGGIVSGSPYRKTAQSTDSQYAYFLAEEFVVNSSIVTSSVADQYLTAQLQQKSSPKYLMQIQIPNTDFRFEDTLPLGRVSIYDPEYDEDSVTAGIWGTLANGGSDWIWGKIASGGRGAIWGGGGGGYQDQINSIQYTLSNTDGRFNIELSLGGTTDETAAKLKRLDLLTDNIRRRG